MVRPGCETGRCGKIGGFAVCRCCTEYEREGTGTLEVGAAQPKSFPAAQPWWYGNVDEDRAPEAWGSPGTPYCV